MNSLIHHYVTFALIVNSGRSPSEISLEAVEHLGFSRVQPIPVTHGLNVTVPGAAAGWVDTVTQFGSGKVSCLVCLS